MPRSALRIGAFLRPAEETKGTLTPLDDILSFQNPKRDGITSPPETAGTDRDIMTSSDRNRIGYDVPGGGHHVASERLCLPVNVTVVSGREEHPSDDANKLIVAMFRQALDVFTSLCEDLRPMTPDRVKLIREGMGLSQEAFSQVLRLGAHGKRTVARWEAGDNPVPGPASVALEALEAGWRPGDGCWRDMRAGYLAVLDVIEKALQEAREDVRRIGTESSERSPGVE